MATENLPHVVADFNLFASIKCFFSKIAKALNMNNFKAPLPQLQGKRDKIEVVFELLWKDSCNWDKFFSRPYFPYKRISSSHKALLGRSALCVENKKRLKQFSLWSPFSSGVMSFFFNLWVLLDIYRKSGSEQLQNTQLLIYMSSNKNSLYCVMPRSWKPPDTYKRGGPKWPGILQFSLKILRKGK